MKIIHTSDWHLGRTLHGASLEPAHRAFFATLVDLVRRERIGALLVSGDLFDRAVPSTQSLRLAREALSELAHLTRVIVITGNHDSDDRLGLTSAFLDDRLVFRALPDDIDRPVDLVEAGRVVARVYTLPYLDPNLARFALADDEGDISDPSDLDTPPQLARTHEAVLAAAARRCRRHLDAHPLPPDARVIVMTHAFLTGGLPTDSERRVDVGGVEDASARLLTHLGDTSGPVRVDYVAAGHLHRPQDLPGAGAPVRYAGSPLAFSFGEAEHEKSVTLLDTAADDWGRREVELRPWRRLRRVRSTLADLRAGAAAPYTDDWCEVTITDEARPLNLVSEVKTLLPHALAVIHAPETLRPLATDGPRLARRLDHAEVACDFATQVGNTALSDAERAVWRDVFEDLRRSERS